MKSKSTGGISFTVKECFMERKIFYEANSIIAKKTQMW